jgi:ketosteroid isomerase-like protein
MNQLTDNFSCKFKIKNMWERRMKADTKTEKEIKTILQEFADSYAKRNLDGVMAHISPDPDMIMYGTALDEKRIGREGLKAQAERDWSQSDSTSMSYGWTLVSAAGPVAWVSSDVTFRVTFDGQEMAFPVRLTGVFENRKGQWLVSQLHFSAPASQPEGSSFQT